MNAHTPLAKSRSELLRAVIDNLAEGVLIYDREGKEVATVSAPAAAMH